MRVSAPGEEAGGKNVKGAWWRQVARGRALEGYEPLTDFCWGLSDFKRVQLIDLTSKHQMSKKFKVNQLISENLGSVRSGREGCFHENPTHLQKLLRECVLSRLQRGRAGGGVQTWKYFRSSVITTKQQNLTFRLISRTSKSWWWRWCCWNYLFP